MNKFIVCIEHETVAEINSFVEYLKSIGAGWWHRTTNTWFISLHSQLDRKELRDTALYYFPKRKILVVDIKTGTWSGFGKEEEFSWFNQSWEDN